MRTIEWTNQFKRDYKRECKGPYRVSLDNDLFPVIDALANDVPLAHRYRDHGLTGDWKLYRDCHIKPDLVLIYQKIEVSIIRLIRLGSHSALDL